LPAKSPQLLHGPNRIRDQNAQPPMSLVVSKFGHFQAGGAAC